MRIGLTIACVIVCVNASMGQELSKKLQKEKADFEAKIEREENFKETKERAERAFENKDYVSARMSYEEAIQYAPEEEQWLQSKVNDLDILMARIAARAIDSIYEDIPRIQAQTLPSQQKSKVEERSLEEAPPTVVEVVEDDSAQLIAESLEPPRETVPQDGEVLPQSKTSIPPDQTVSSRNIQMTPKPLEVSEAKSEERVKVKEDFSGFDDGITEETFNLDNSNVLRVVVKEGIDVIVFKRVKHRWGGEFFFMDDRDVTRRYWDEQVAMYREKYPEN